jgi:large subunit ribosomal protein L15
MKAFYAEVRLNELNTLAASEVTLVTLVAAGLVPSRTKTVKIIKSGTLDKAVQIKGLRVTAGAKEVITSAGGSIEE